MGHDWNELIWRQSGCLADLIEGLDDADFDKPSLCEGWMVRDVIGHMLVGHTTPLPKMLALVASYRGNIDKGSYEKSKELAASLSADELRRQWRAVVEDRTRKGISLMIPLKVGFLDHFVHEQDIRRPLGLAAPDDAARLRPALDATVSVRTPIFAPARAVRGLRLETTDLDWTHGEGGLVRGPAEAIVMAAAGRHAALDDLEGDGVERLIS